MKRHLCAANLFLLIISLFACASRDVVLQDGKPSKPLRPNIVLIMIDDLGWSDLGCYGNDFVETPHIDRLAAQGMRFTDFYASGAVCSPTRAAIQSGQNPARNGVTAHIPGHWRPFECVITPQTAMALPLETVTVAESLKKAGYATGYVGKWHLGNVATFGPGKQGYDFAAVINGPHLPGRYRVASNNAMKPKAGQYRTDYEADLSIQFIRQHKDQPFFLMLSPYAVHIPLAAMSEKVEKYKKKAKQRGTKMPHPVYAAMIEHCDDMVGRIIDALEVEGLTDDTMIVFTSDNGGLFRRYDYRAAADDDVTTNAPLRDEKGTLYEGGIRVPLIVKYPNLVKGGGTCDESAISHDFYPTFIDLVGGSLPRNQPIDGQSLLPWLASSPNPLNRSPLFWHYPHYHHGRPAGAIRDGPWKLIEYLDGENDLELYNLAEDIGESTNLASTEPERVQSMRKRLKAWRTATLARIPIANPSYDPDRAHEWWNRSNGKPVPSDKRKRFPPTEKH